MKNTLETSTDINDHSQLWNDIKQSWIINKNGEHISGVTVSNEKPIDNNPMNILIAPCPCYAPGPLEGSDLLVPSHPISTHGEADTFIKSSRVANKLWAYEAVLSKMSHIAAQIGQPMQLMVAFADMGVLLNHTPNDGHVQALKTHAEAYRLWFEKFCEDHAVNHSFTTFTEQECQRRSIC